MRRILCSREFDPGLGEIASARRLVRESVPAWLDGRADDLVLVVSELVSNAVLHARGTFTLTVSSKGEVLRVEVTDPNPRMPMLAATSDSALSGRGLLMVQALASAWGVEQHAGDGKTVWAELSPAR